MLMVEFIDTFENFEEYIEIHRNVGFEDCACLTEEQFNEVKNGNYCEE